MKTLVLFITSLCFIVNLFAQNPIEERIKDLFENEQYRTIIKEYAIQEADYSANTLYHIGASYMLLEDDENCIKYMDLAIAKDSSLPETYFSKAVSLSYLGYPREAIQLYQKSISLEVRNDKLAVSYTRLGEVYYHISEINLALIAYGKALEYNKSEPTPYLMIGQIYSDLNEKDKALKIYYEGRQNVEVHRKTDVYIDMLFNLGLMEQLNENYSAAESIFNELISIQPNDFHSYAKLIQIYNHNMEYEKITLLKGKLYEAHKEDILDGNLSEMFCIDQFKWRNKKIKVFERYEEGNTLYIYYKIIFYILDEENNIEFTIQTEYSPAAVSFGEAKYILCADKEDTHINYGIGFDDNSTYESIKKTVVAILDREE